MTKVYEHNDLAGCVELRRSRTTGHMVGLYHAEQAGMDPDSGAWATVCEEHASICNHSTLAHARAHLGDPTMWCALCREEQDAQGA